MFDVGRWMFRHSGAERICAAGKSGPLLENVVEINGPSAGDEVGLVWNTFGRERDRELARSAAEVLEIELEKITKSNCASSPPAHAGARRREFRAAAH